MTKFTKHETTIPEVSTASLPDIVFMLLFFFMTVTVMKDNSLKVDNDLPNASEVKKLEKRDRIIYVYVGRPTGVFLEVLGSEPRIQLNDKFASVEDIGPFILQKRSELPEHLRPLVTVALKIDKKANMGLIDDIKQALREVGALKINYTTYEGDAFKNLQ